MLLKNTISLNYLNAILINHFSERVKGAHKITNVPDDILQYGIQIFWGLKGTTYLQVTCFQFTFLSKFHLFLSFIALRQGGSHINSA